MEGYWLLAIGRWQKRTSIDSKLISEIIESGV